MPPEKSKSKLRIGFIGTGNVAQGHVRRTLEHSRAEIVGLCDPSDAMLDRTLRNYPQLADVPRYKDYREMIAAGGLDATSIQTPHIVHYEQVMASLDAGLHVLVEKPFVGTVEEAKSVMAKAKEIGKVILVSYQRHFNAGFRYIRDAIAGGKLGEIQMVTAYVAQNWMIATTGKWRQDPALSGGGQLNDTGSHLVDVTLWTTGLRAAKVSAFIESFDRRVDINSVVNIEFDNGALGTVIVNGNAPVWHEEFIITGSKGAIMQGHGKFLHQDRETGAVWQVDGLRDRGNPDANFIDAILDGAEIQVPPECGLRVIELTQAAYESAKQGGKVIEIQA